MTGNNAALDTNTAVAILNDNRAALAWLASVKGIYIPVPVLAELCFGALNSSRVQENMARLTTMERRATVLSATANTARAYAEARLQLKRAGKPIPHNDLWIASICIENGVPLATRDRHFAAIDALQTIEPF